MRPVLKAIAVALPLSMGALIPGSAAVAQEQAQEPGKEQAKQQGMPSSEPKAVAERKRLAADIVVRALPASRLPEIYADLRYALGELYLPALREALNDTASAKRDPETLAKLAAIVPVIDYALRAAGELDPVIAASRDELIGEITDYQAKYMSEEEIRFAGEILDTPATRKGFNAFYALSRYLTAYDKEDLRASREMSAWMKDLTFDAATNPFTPNMPPPPPARVAKATAVVTDLMRISHVDDMVADIIAFTRNVVLEVDALKPEEVEAVRGGLQQFEFYYNLGKSMAVAVAPSMIAAALTDEQLGKLHLMILSPVMAKSFTLLYTAVRESTSFTKQDIGEFRRLGEKGEVISAKWERGPEVQAKMSAEWDASTAKWRGRLEAALTPETRQGLETSVAVLSALMAEEEAKKTAPESKKIMAPAETMPRGTEGKNAQAAPAGKKPQTAEGEKSQTAADGKPERPATAVGQKAPAADGNQRRAVDGTKQQATIGIARSVAVGVGVKAANDAPGDESDDDDEESAEAK